MAFSDSKIQVSRQDVWWGYAAQFFALASGVIILPLVLRLLSGEEVGMNYLMLSVATLATLVDFGFSTQFATHITYVYSGASYLQKEGLAKEGLFPPGQLNYRLLATLIRTARWLYRLLGGLVLVVMLTIGTAYVHRVTHGFTNVRHSFLIWVVYSFSIFFQIYYAYYGALLLGSGKIRESKKASVYTNLLKIGLTYLLLLTGCGLLGLVLANLLSPFLTRYLSYRYYFTLRQRVRLRPYLISFAEQWQLFRLVWHNSKKMGLCSFAYYLTHGATLILAGLYLPLHEVASYGLMVQLLTLLSSVSCILFTLYFPRFGSLRMQHRADILLRESALTFAVFYGSYLLGALAIIIGGNFLLQLIGSTTFLPGTGILAFASWVWFLDGNAWNCCLLIASRNHFPFLPSVFLTAVSVMGASYVALVWVGGGIWALLLVQAVVQGITYVWYWPRYVMDELHTTWWRFIRIGREEMGRQATLLFKDGLRKYHRIFFCKLKK